MVHNFGSSPLGILFEQVELIAGSSVKLVSGEGERWLDADQIVYLRFEPNCLPTFGPDEDATGLFAMFEPNSTAYFAIERNVRTSIYSHEGGRVVNVERLVIQPPFDVFIGRPDTTDIHASGRVVHVSGDFVALEGTDASYVLPSDCIGLLRTIPDSN